MPQLQLLDEETGGKYIFNLTEHEFARASTDVVYSMQLLAKAKAENSEENHNEEEETCVTEVYNGFRWVDETVRLLLTAYKQNENLLSTGKVSKKKFWEIISQILKEKSYNITGSQCKSKFHGLKKTYKSVKDYNSRNSRNRRTWSYFETMDEILGYKTWVTPVLTLDTSNNIPTPASPSSNSSNSPIPSSPSVFEPPRKRQKVTQEATLDKLLTIVKESKEERKKMHEDAVARQDRLLTLLEKNEAPRKRQKLTQETILEKLFTIVQESKEERKKMHEDIVARQDRLLALLEKIINKE